MLTRPLLYLFTLILISACESVPQIIETGLNISQAAGYSPKQLDKSVKDALTLSSTRASEMLSQRGAYSSNYRFRIGLPAPVQNIAAALRRIGLNQQVDEIEGLMNTGAERAAAEAQSLLIQTVRDMPLQDALGIIRGGNTAATDYFRQQTEAALTQRYHEIIRTQLEQIGFYSEYQQLLRVYRLAPIPNKPDLDLEQHTVNRGLNALFIQIAEEEKKIRANPVEQGSVLIGTIFSSSKK
ncbi:MAG: hypothetical protein COA42_11100 [Alteromonadaceae bacterium]|nr:MAG: hypothetical protein COA42_11100 [Alteromonadaceae bacterium]